MSKQLFIRIVTALLIVVAGIKHSQTSSVQSGAVPRPKSQSSFSQNTDNKVEVAALGTKVPVSYECLGSDEADEANVFALPSGRTLVGICDVLFMVDNRWKLVWEYRVPQILIDFAFIPQTGLIYGTAGDNVMFILEASTGKKLLGNGRNGSAAYGQVKPYGNDACLITDNNWGYRDRLGDATIPDHVTAWRGTEVVWGADLPPGANLIVKGDKVFALTKTKDGIFIKEISVPNT